MSVKTLWPDDVARAMPDISKITEMCVERRELCVFGSGFYLAWFSCVSFDSLYVFSLTRCCDIIVKIFVAFSGLPFGGLR